MSSTKYAQLSIDGVIGDVYDPDAVHEDDLADKIITALSDSSLLAALLDITHPIGSYFISDSSTDPSNLFGGTWSAVEGVFLIGASSTYSAGSTGGYTDAIIPSHTHTGTVTIASAGAHTHTVTGSAASAGSHTHGTSSDYKFSIYKGTRSSETIGAISGSGWIMTQVASGGAWSGASATASAGAHTHIVSGTATSAGAHKHTGTVSIASTGVSVTGKNLPPYKAVYMWVRTA